MYPIRMVKDSEIEVLLEGGGYSNYMWSTVQIGTTKDAQLYIRHGAGCSCNWISEEYWEPLTNIAQVQLSANSVFSEKTEEEMWNLVSKAKFISAAQTLFSRY